jgi:hypothetical protein
MDDSEVVTFGLQSADKEAVEDTLQESELESARMENIIQSKMTTVIQQALPITVFNSKFLRIPPLPPNATSAPLVLESDTQRQRCSQNLKGILKAVKLVSRDN